MKKLAILFLILATLLCFASCSDDDVDRVLERLPYDIEGWHEHSWDNWDIAYDEVNAHLICSLCKAKVMSFPISQGLEIDENGVLWDRGTCKDVYIVVPYGVTAVGEGAFSNTKDILGVLLPDTVTEIRDNAFKSCDGLQVINIPNRVTTIGEKAFHSCKSLIGVLVPHSVTKIGKQAFANCGYLEIIYYVGTEADWTNVEKGQNWDQGAGKHVVEFKMIIGDDPFVDTEESLEYFLNEDGKSYSVVGIGTCTSMDIVIPSTHKGLPVTAIGASAFYKDEITSVSIPNSVTNIGNQAFRDCENLQNFTIPESVVSIGEKAFIACRSLTEVIIPDSVTTIGPEAFRECSSLKSITLGKGLTVIENDMFHSCLALESIVIPDNIVTIRQEAFRYCTSLVNIDLGKGLKILGNDVFHSCPVLKTIVIPDGVTILEVETFRDCYLLENVVLGKGITTIGDYALAECPALKTITIPDTVTVIGDGAFYCSTSLETVYIGSGLNSIVAWGFYGCKSLTSIYYNGTISQWKNISFGWYWDYDTPNYTIYCTDGTIAKDGTVTYYEPEPQPEGSQGLEYALNEDGQSYSVVGMGTCADTNLVIPSTYNALPVTNIGANAFKECEFIVSVVIMEGIENIYQNAFRNCINLEKVEFPDSLRFIEGFAGESVFYGCKKLLVSENGIYYVDNWVIAVDFNTVPDCVTIKEGTIAIAMHGLIGLPSSKIVIPESVKIICWNGIFFAENLNTVFYLGNADDWNAIDIGVGNEVITDAARYHCSESEPTTEGNYWHYVEGVPTIWGASDEQPEETPEASQGLEYALNADGQSYSVVGMGTCTDTNLVIPSTYNGLPVTAIADIAFASLDANYMPRDPYNIVSVKLPETIKTIGVMAFAGIPTLKNVDLPDSIEIVQGYAFVGSEALEYAEYDGALYLGNENNPYLVFVNPKDTNVISCRIHDETKVIGGIAFNEFKMLETVYLGDGVKYISPSAFMGCSMLSNFIIGEGSSLISIANSAFYGCSSLVNIELPNSLKNIDNRTFAQCTSLTKVVIPESVENIGEYAFEWCSSLTIYCEAESQPTEWNSNWNSKGAYSGDQFIPVIWGYQPE